MVLAKDGFAVTEGSYDEATEKERTAGRAAEDIAEDEAGEKEEKQEGIAS